MPACISTPFPMRRTLVLLSLAVSSVVLSGCATHIAPQEQNNPPPTEKFSAFNRFELLPIRQVSLHQVSPAALNKIQQNIDVRLRRQIEDWNEKPIEGAVRTLVIQPEITDAKFVSGAKRFWLGPFPGSSAAILRARFTEKGTDKLIAEAEFYVRAQAMGGTFTIGATDNIMLIRIANSFSVYVLRNYPRAVGGPVMPPSEEAPALK